MMKSLRERFVKFRRAFRWHLKQRCCTLLWTECPWPFIGPWWARRNFGQSNGHQWEISISLAAGPKLISRAPWNLQPEVATLQQTNSCSYVGVKVGPQAQLHTACCKQFEKGRQAFCASTFFFGICFGMIQVAYCSRLMFQVGSKLVGSMQVTQVTNNSGKNLTHLKVEELVNWYCKLKIPSTLGLLMFWIMSIHHTIRCQSLPTSQHTWGLPFRTQRSRCQPVWLESWTFCGPTCWHRSFEVWPGNSVQGPCRVNYFTESIHIPVTQSSERLEAALGSYRMTLTRTSERLDRYFPFFLRSEWVVGRLQQLKASFEKSCLGDERTILRAV